MNSETYTANIEFCVNNTQWQKCYLEDHYNGHSEPKIAIVAIPMGCPERL